MTDKLIDHASRRFAEEARKEYGEKLRSVILFGSCARGDYDNDSDLDIMILLSSDPAAIADERARILPVISRLDSEFDYEVLFSPIIQSEAVYNRFLSVLPFYRTVEKEGIKYA